MNVLYYLIMYAKSFYFWFHCLKKKKKKGKKEKKKKRKGTRVCFSFFQYCIHMQICSIYECIRPQIWLCFHIHYLHLHNHYTNFIGTVWHTKSDVFWIKTNYWNYTLKCWNWIISIQLSCLNEFYSPFGLTEPQRLMPMLTQSAATVLSKANL